MKLWDEVKSALIGLPLLWLFAIGAGYMLIFLNDHYWMWLVLLFVVFPSIGWLMRVTYQRKQKKQG